MRLERETETEREREREWMTEREKERQTDSVRTLLERKFESAETVRQVRWERSVRS